MKKLLSLAVLVAIAAGCANISHKRQVTTALDGTKTVTETETGHFLFEKEVAQKVSISTRDNPTNYTHTFSATGLSITGDAELATAVGTQVNNGFKNGAAAAGKAIIP